MNRWLKSILPLLWLQSCLVAQDDQFFEQKIAPVFQEHCAECHNHDDANGGLNIHAAATFFQVADSGKRPIVAGEPPKSEMLHRITTEGEDLRMPPEGDALSSEHIANVKEWISNGAKIPRNYGSQFVQEGAGSKDSEHWSFQPVTSPTPPEVKDANWSASAIDRFLEAQREKAGLTAVAEAKPETLIRRASYALTGLPPTVEEVDAFVAAVRTSGLQTAFTDLCDDLLARKTYGERWGRHWMDWVRYADTSGDNSDFPIPQAYLYRNYIIESLNNDVPYDRFLVEQLAGDLLPAADRAEKNRLVIATGYLAMARRFGSLVETYPWHLTIEDTIDNMGRTMMGLTIACARCHDHKFDPISTRDYYGLYGIFESTQYAFPGTELFQVQQDLVPLIADEEVSEVLGKHDAKTQKLTRELKRQLANCRKRELEIAAVESSLSLAEQRKQRDQLDSMLLKARKAGTALADHLKTLPTIPTAYAVQDGQAAETRIQIKGEPTRLGATVPRKFPDVLGGFAVEAKEHSGRLELAKWITDSNNPLTARVIVNRVWERHFGRGLVASTSDFGLRGESPSHPELLDWLASDFMENGWSIKHLHRTIMNTRAYRLASYDNSDSASKAQTLDPNNQFLWKFNRHRLDAESIRDSLLQIAGTLDPSPQSEPYPIPEQKDWEYTQHHPFKDNYPNSKRSVYQMTKRLTVGSYMQTFDGPDPNVCTSKRDQSVTALQALYFVNDDFLHEQAENIAERFCGGKVGTGRTTQAKLERLVAEILGRRPNQEEIDVLAKHLASAQERLQASATTAENVNANNVAAASLSTDDIDKLAWSSLVRSLFRLNEFLYID